MWYLVPGTSIYHWLGCRRAVCTRTYSFLIMVGHAYSTVDHGEEPFFQNVFLFPLSFLFCPTFYIFLVNSGRERKYPFFLKEIISTSELFFSLLLPCASSQGFSTTSCYTPRPPPCLVLVVFVASFSCAASPPRRLVVSSSPSDIT